MTAEQKNTPVFRSSALMRRLKPENRRERMKMRPNPQIVSPVHNDSRPQKSSAPFWVVFRGKACGFEAQAEKSRTARLSGARNEVLW